jgi:hypothetical protein
VPVPDGRGCSFPASQPGERLQGIFEDLAVISSAVRTYRIAGDHVPLESTGAAGAQLVVPEPGESLLDATLALARSAVASAEAAETSDTEDEELREGEADAEDLDAESDDQYDLLGVVGE